MEQKSVKCDKCDQEFTPEEAIENPTRLYVYKGKVLCENCLIDMGVSPESTESYWTYVSGRHDIDMGI